MSNPLRSSGNSASPFIKREQHRREFLRSRSKKNATPKPFVKKEDPEAYDERTSQILQGSGSSSKKVKQENGAGYNEFPLRAVSSEKLENIRTHILKFQSKKKIDPTKDFHLPIRLHRKDTRNLQFQLTRAEIVQRQKEIAEFKNRADDEEKDDENSSKTNTPSVIDVEEAPSTSSVKEEPKSPENPAQPTPPVTVLEEAGPAEDPTKVGMVKYDGQEQPAIDEDESADPFADVAPDGGGRYRRGNSKRKTRQLKLLDENAKRLRFEEFYPWVMEDFDGLNTWVGSYEAGNSDSYVLLSVENDGSFTMVPADKVYKFTARNKYATLTIEEAEKRMEKNGKGVPRWLMKHLDDIGTTTTRYDRTRRRLKAVDAREGDDEDRGDNSEVELDFDEEFADDEEAPIIDGNEQENKESEDRIKKEMLQANAMGLRDDEEIDDDLFGEKKMDDEGERVKKALQKSDAAALYESDDDELNPYLSESDLEDQDANTVKQEDQENGRSSRKGSPKKKSSRGSPSAPQIYVKSIKDCMIVLKAGKSVLNNFPSGEWNPQAKKRTSEQPADLGSAKGGAESDENAENILTEDDIINAVSGKRMTLKQLIRELREKVSKHPSNKERMKLLVKRLVKLNDGYLELNK